MIHAQLTAHRILKYWIHVKDTKSLILFMKMNFVNFMTMIKPILVLIAFLLFQYSFGQERDSTSTDSLHPTSVSGFPVLFYLPETSLAFGALGTTSFNIGKERSFRPSQVLLSFAYTLKKQVLIFAPYELYYKQKWKMEGELGYYKYFYNYYGVGSDSKKENLETFNADFPRVINTLSYRFIPSSFIGIRVHFDRFSVKNRDSLLLSDAPTGVNGGALVSAGLTYSLDTRNDIFYPTKGIYINFISELSSTGALSDFNYSLFQVSASHYFEFVDKHILASNITTGTIAGDAPFFSYFYMSSSKLARGHADRRFIDRNIAVMQAEYRFPIYKRLRGVAFGAFGNVGNTYGEIFSNNMKLSGGAGLRFQLNKKIMNHLRVDLAGSREGLQFYLTVGESF